MYSCIINREDEGSCVSLNPIGAAMLALYNINFIKRKKKHGIGYAVHSHIFFISKILEEHQKWFLFQWGPSLEECNLLPNETGSHNNMYQSEIQKEKIVPLVLMDWRLPQMSSLLKPHRADNENFSVIEPQVLRNVPNETCASVPTDRVISYLGKVLSEFSGKLALLRGEKKKKRIFQSFEDKV